MTHIGFSRNIHKLWPNTYFANAGLFALHAAWHTARQSRWGNHQLESRARECRLHGAEGGEGEVQRAAPTWS